MSSLKNSLHYDTVVSTWRRLMGDSFHWGYFENPAGCLEEATVALTFLLAGFVDLGPHSRVIDIGCGIGQPATHLHRRYGCHVVGISNSRIGIERAAALARERGLEDSLEFYFADALANGFADCLFDVAWLMEMSHLIQDKQALIDEAVRSIKPGGQVALCDLAFNRRPLPREVFSHLEDHRSLKRAFGEAQLEEPVVYREMFSQAGLVDIQMKNISSAVIPTLHHWRANAMDALQLTDESQREPIRDFFRSCEILERFYNEGTWGYFCIAGRKPA